MNGPKRIGIILGFGIVIGLLLGLAVSGGASRLAELWSERVATAQSPPPMGRDESPRPHPNDFMLQPRE